MRALRQAAAWRAGFPAQSKIAEASCAECPGSITKPASVSWSRRAASESVGLPVRLGAGARVGTVTAATEFTEPGRGHRRGGCGGQGGILMIFLWQLMVNYGEFQVDLFGDYLDRQTDGRTDISLFGAALMV